MSLPLPLPRRTMPTDFGCSTSVALTLLSPSVRSRTRATLANTRSTTPTRPRAVTTTSPAATPLFDPAAIVRLWSSALCGFVSTSAFTLSKFASLGAAW